MDETVWDSPPQIPDPYKDYRVVHSQPFDETTISIRTEGDEIPMHEAERLASNSHRAVQLSYQIAGREVDWIKGGISINVRNKGFLTKTLMTTSFDANHRLLEEDDESQTAAVLHELIEGIEEDLPGLRVPNSETLPLLSEFLFCGKTREPFFLHLTQQTISKATEGKEIGLHASGWEKSLELLSKRLGLDLKIEGASPDEVFSRIALAKNLSEAEKINLIKSSIKLFEATPS